MDHQVVNLLFDNEVTVAFTMTAFTNQINRTFKIMGTKGEIRGDSLKNDIEIKYFTGRVERVTPETIEGGHEGSDTLIMEDFIKQIKNNSNESTTSTMVSAKSHLITFAAEESRVTGKTIEMEEYIKGLKNSTPVV